jgi:hypothetical protein
LRHIGWLVFLAGCGAASIGIEDGKSSTVVHSEPGTGFSTGPWEEPVTSAPEEEPASYEGAYARILSPGPDSLVPLGQPYTYEVGLFAADGSPLELSPPEITITWFSSVDPDFGEPSLQFTTDAMAVGIHELTAVVDLPTGDRLAHSVGGVRVQSELAGTYAGLFSVDGSVNSIPVSCTGAAVVVVDVYGETGEGQGDCIVSLLALDVPMSWDFRLDSGTTLTGEAGVDLLGIFSYDIPMTVGTVDPAGAGLELEFAGPIPLVGEMSAFLDAPRVSLDVD